MKSSQNDIKTVGYVLRRTNYAEADRILNLITPVGKMSAIAKGVRKAKSKLAGGVEMFTKSEIVVHEGHGGIGVLTSAKMVRYCGNIVKDLSKMELAAMMLKRVSSVAEGAETAEYFEIIDQGLTALDDGVDATLIETWYLMNILRVAGEEVNLYRDVLGDKLAAGTRYAWDSMERAFFQSENGEFGTDEIKLMRLMVNVKPKAVARVKDVEGMLPGIVQMVRSAAR